MTAIGNAPFDAVAAGYDAGFTETRLGRHLRAIVWERLARHFTAGSRVLDLGCGTGEDAVWLARRGIEVTATDLSAAMLDVTRQKSVAAEVSERVTVRRLDLAAPAWEVGGFDGAYSNFGAINCVPDLTALARTLARSIRPGGVVILVVMGPICPWETLWFLAHGRPAAAGRRWRRGGVSATVGGQPVRVRYPSSGRLAGAFGPWFQATFRRGVGVLLPSSEAGPLVERQPALFARLATVERQLAARWPLPLLGDHYLIELTRRSGTAGVPGTFLGGALLGAPASGRPAAGTAALPGRPKTLPATRPEAR